MRVAIVGNPISGKTALFTAISGVPADHLKLAEENLARMDVFVGLLTTAFLASDFIQTVELGAARQKLREMGLYPTEIRNTGIGWGIGAGRIGAIVGPKIGGTLIGMGLALSTNFIIFSVPLVIAAVATRMIKSDKVS